MVLREISQTQKDEILHFPHVEFYTHATRKQKGMNKVGWERVGECEDMRDTLVAPNTLYSECTLVKQ